MGKKIVGSKIGFIVHHLTWELLNLSPRSKPPGHEWIFKVKMKIDGTINKYKLRSIGKGFKQ
jgi:hypothetical protein